jgi:hypothetical protein
MCSRKNLTNSVQILERKNLFDPVNICWQVRCMELKRADHIAAPSKGSSKDGESVKGSSAGLCYCIEIKDAYLPPWIMCSICDVMSSEGRSFEARYHKY